MIRRQSARVCVHPPEPRLPAEPCGFCLEVRRERRTKLSIWAKNAEPAPSSGQPVKAGWNKVAQPKTPLQTLQALKAEAQRNKIEFDWNMAFAAIASIDWVSASVMAAAKRQVAPDLPATELLLSQRSLRALTKVTVAVEWGYALHQISMPFEQWVRILNGESYLAELPYVYEGERYTSEWHFDGQGNLEVCYDDAAVGWTGTLSDIGQLSGPVIDGIDLAGLALRAAAR